MTKVIKNLALVSMLAVGGAGCVAQTQLDEMMHAYRVSEEQNEDLRAEVGDMQARIQAMGNGSGQITVVSSGTGELQAARDRISHLESTLQQTEDQIRGLAQQTSQPLPQQLDDELANFAAANVGLMTYDKHRGMIKVASDLTFALGSDVVNSRAGASLTDLAAILNSPQALGYEVRVVGHTDSTQIQKTKDRHPTNWHLSAHRAIAVMDVLRGAGVPESRISVAGYGKHRPIAADGPKGNRANRRVEIFMVPDHGRSGLPMASSPATPVDPSDFK